VRIHHEQHGDGHPIVLVHGWGLDARRNWMDTGWVDALVPHRRVVLLDVRGHGRSDKPHTPGSYTYRAMTADVLQVMDELGIDTADLLGYSMGSFIGVALLGTGSARRFTSMILGGIGDETESSAAAATTIATALRAADPTTIDDPIGRAYRAFVDLDPTTDLEALAVAALDMWPDGHPLELGGAALRDADLPVLIVNGADDRPYVDSAHRLVSALRRATEVIVPDADHLTTAMDRRFRDAALDFLSTSS
jgi:pimeloyl-ACP methyl ester carboxylesterase